jgi:hypothetical protein
LGQPATPFIAYECIVWCGWREAGKCLPFTANQIKSPYALWADSYIEKAPVAKSAEKRARKSAQMGATWIINSSVYYDAVNKFLLPHP